MHSDLVLLLSEAEGELRFYKNEVLKDVLYYGSAATFHPTALFRHVRADFNRPYRACADLPQ